MKGPSIVAEVPQDCVIGVDIGGTKLDINVPLEELEKRRRAWKPRKKVLAGVLARYAETVGQANLGDVQR